MWHRLELESPCFLGNGSFYFTELYESQEQYFLQEMVFHILTSITIKQDVSKQKSCFLKSLQFSEVFRVSPIQVL